MTPTFFGMMVITAIVTTVGGGPLFDWISRPDPVPSPLEVAEVETVS